MTHNGLSTHTIELADMMLLVCHPLGQLYEFDLQEKILMLSYGSNDVFKNHVTWIYLTKKREKEFQHFIRKVNNCLPYSKPLYIHSVLVYFNIYKVVFYPYSPSNSWLPDPLTSFGPQLSCTQTTWVIYYYT